MFFQETEELKCLQFLSQALEWTRLVCKRYRGKIDRKQGRELLVAQVLAETPKSEAQMWISAWEGWTKAWNASYRFVERYECLEIPAEYRNISMNIRTPIAFSLPSNQDEGLCPSALLQWLVELHNRCMEEVGRLLLLQGREQGVVRIPSRFVSSVHVLRFDIENEVVPFLEKQAVTMSCEVSNTRQKSDDSSQAYFAAEQFLLDTFFAAKFPIDLNLKLFEFANEKMTSKSAMDEKVPQEPIPKEISERVERGLSSIAFAQQCLELIEVCMNFLQATGGSIVGSLGEDVGNKLLLVYIRDVLLMKDDSEVEIFNSILQGVQLKHLSSLRAILKDMTTVDPLEKVNGAYKEDLPVVNRLLLKQFAENVTQSGQMGVLLTSIKDFMIEYLCDDVVTMSKGCSFADDVAPYIRLVSQPGAVQYQADSNLGDAEWFKSQFPANIELKCIVSVYRFLEDF
jgi:hypothetical protein